MKKMLALLMLVCLLVPACALAADTLTVRKLDDQGKPVGDPIAKNAAGAYALENGVSYVMQGESAAGVKLHVSGEADVLLDGVRVETADEFALHVMGGGELNLVANGENSLVSSYAGESHVQYFKDIYWHLEKPINGGGGLYTQAETVISSISSSASLHIEGSLFGGFAQGVNVHVTMPGLTVVETNDYEYDAFEWDSEGSFTVDEEVAVQVRDEEDMNWAGAGSEQAEIYNMLRTLEADVTLTFYDEEGSLYAEVGAVVGGIYHLPAYSPAKEGMLFDGWLSDGETYMDSVEPEASMTFRAIVKPSVEVIYRTPGGEPETNPYHVDPDAFTPSEYDNVLGDRPLEDGKVLAYWQGSDGKQYRPDETYQISGNLTLTAVPAKACRITYLHPDGESYDEVTVAEGEKVPMISYDNYDVSFVGWKAEGGTVYTDENAPVAAGDMTLTAVVRRIFTITYRDPDGAWYDEASIEEGEKVPMLSYDDPNCIFLGWKAEDGTIYTDGNAPVATGDMTLRAHVVNAATIRFLKPKGGLWQEEKVGINTLYGVSGYADYGFVYWEKLPGGEIVYAGDTLRVTGNITLKAVVKPFVNLSFDYGDGKPVPPLRIPEGEVEFTPSQHYGREGFVHTGWKVSDVDMVLPCDTAFYADRDLTFIAQYEEAETVKLTYLAPDGKPLYVDHAPKGEAYDLICSHSELTEEQFFINGLKHWVSGGKSYERGATIYPTQDMTFTAELERQEHISVWVADVDKLDEPDSYAARLGNYVGSKFHVDDVAWYSVPTRGRAPEYIRVRNPGGDTQGDTQGKRHELDEWLEFGTDVKHNALIVIYWKELNAVSIPEPDGSMADDQLTASDVAAADLPKTGDPSSLMGWMALLGASAMGLKLRRKK